MVHNKEMVDGFIYGCETQKTPRQTNYSPYHKKTSASFQAAKYLLLTLLWYKKQPCINMTVIYSYVIILIDKLEFTFIIYPYRCYFYALSLIHFAGTKTFFLFFAKSVHFQNRMCAPPFSSRFLQFYPIFRAFERPLSTFVYL